MKKQINHDKPPYYAYFEHADGSWYMLWMTHTKPKTERGHDWHVHATFEKHDVTKPNIPGMRNLMGHPTGILILLRARWNIFTRNAIYCGCSMDMNLLLLISRWIGRRRGSNVL